jgi:hypothetical protein
MKEMKRMRIFGKERQSLRIQKVRASRAIYVRPGNPDEQEVELQLTTEDGERLDLRMRTGLVRQLILDLSDSYEAIAPALSRGRWNAGQQGMSD